MSEDKRVELPEVKEMSAVQRSEAAMRVAMQSPQQLRKWLHESGRRWLVFDALELVEALPWPHGVQNLIDTIACYRDHRAAIPSTTGAMVEQKDPHADPSKPRMIQVPVTKPETLESAELEQCIAYLQSLVR